MNEYVDFAKQLALEAGMINVKYFRVGVNTETKSDNSPLTIADTKINDLVITRVNERYPNDSVLGEEKSLDKNSSTVWVVDPIDGTLPFSRGVPTNVFSIALVEDGQPMVAVVYDPHMRRLFTAVKGEGAFLNDDKLHVSDSHELEHGYIVVEGNPRFSNYSYIDKFYNKGIKIFSYGSIVYAHMLVASGQLEASIFALTNPWDCAAAKLIVDEAGGATSNIFGQEQRYDQPLHGFIASCSPKIHHQVLNILADSQPDY